MPTSKLILLVRRISFFRSSFLLFSHLNINEFRALMINRITIFSRLNESWQLSPMVVVSIKCWRKDQLRASLISFPRKPTRRIELLLSLNYIVFSYAVDLIKQVKETQSSSSSWIRLHHASCYLIRTNRFQVRIISDRNDSWVMSGRSFKVKNQQT
jgi:hypothetical protein